MRVDNVAMDIGRRDDIRIGMNVIRKQIWNSTCKKNDRISA